MFSDRNKTYLLAILSLATTSSASYSKVVTGEDCGNPLGYNSTDSNIPLRTAATCSYFKEKFPDMTIVRTEGSAYTAENQVSWNAGAWLGPACVLTPANAEEMSEAVKGLVRFGTPFAMRGGGHMPIPNAANINSTGVLISSSKLTKMELSTDGGTLELAPANRWGDAYIYLNETGTGKMVVGGRYAPVGVPGYLLGGGMSFFSNEYGFSSANGNVRAYECVLADGTIVSATSENEFVDLYWALQGGGNSFCLVTKFDLKTFDSPFIMLADAHYGTGAATKDLWIDSVLNFVLNGSDDPKAAVIPVARFGLGSSEPVYDATLFYNGDVAESTVLNDFQGGLLPKTNSTQLRNLTMAAFAKAVRPAFQEGGESFALQQRFRVIPTLATREAIEIVHDTFRDAIPQVSNLTDFFAGLAWNAITTEFNRASNQGVGCPQGVEEIPLYWVEQALTWGDAADSPTIDAWLHAVGANITAQLEAVGASHPYIYLNDADPDQKVFEGYPADNVKRLQSIRDKYDPQRIFTDLMPGGFKVADVVV
ncbi:FAD binding domain-containing protein [Phlyctema vagabunda]|uniref:FAD binding domain-containing protein n=1 Tax=Phlyctema vagabunda TaxID=108571 RepID=A0ABR4P617_9HELO